MRRNVLIAILIAIGLSFGHEVALAQSESDPSAIITTRVVVNTTQPDDYLSSHRTDTIVLRYDLSRIETIGNHTYIPINKGGTPALWRKDILALLSEFEQSRTNLRVTNWGVEKNQAAHMTYAFVFGLWIDHEPNNVDQSYLSKDAPRPGAKF